MSQATNASTTTRAPAATPVAPPQQLAGRSGTPRQLPSGIQLNWANLLDNLAGIEPPDPIGLAADADDINRRANHLQQVLDAVVSYVRSVVGDTAYRAPSNIHDETGFFADASANIVGELRKSAEALRIEANPGAWLKARQAEVAR